MSTALPKKNDLKVIFFNQPYPVVYQAPTEIEKSEDTGCWTMRRSQFYSQKCQICEVPTTTRCTACKRVAYCCRDHQTEDWSRHKRECREMFVRHQHYLDARQSSIPTLQRLCEDTPATTIRGTFYYFFQPDCGTEDLGYRVHNKSITF